MEDIIITVLSHIIESNPIIIYILYVLFGFLYYLFYKYKLEQERGIIFIFIVILFALHSTLYITKVSIETEVQRSHIAPQSRNGSTEPIKSTTLYFQKLKDKKYVNND